MIKREVRKKIGKYSERDREFLRDLANWYELPVDVVLEHVEQFRFEDKDRELNRSFETKIRIFKYGVDNYKYDGEGFGLIRNDVSYMVDSDEWKS